ncbi:MAG TPA: MFS transporter [Prosthecobacter sp.]|nr:MFS transporter [Prosthecobacter sp.]HRK15008.1 MFS transporter [Prosthecobacter sp.]
MPAPRPSFWKWYVCGLLLLATTINYMDRQTLSNAAVRVTREFGLSQEQYGDLELAFGWAFAAGSLVFGFLADRFRVYWLYPIVLAGWSLMGIASAHTRDYPELMICRVLLGFFEAGHWPCALKTTFALLRPEDRTMGNSVLQSGASIGAVVTPPIMIWLMTEDVSSWRLAFQVIGAAGLVWVVLWFASIRRVELDVVAPMEKAAFEGLLGILLGRRFWALAALIFGAQTCWHLFRVWLPKFMQEGRGYSETEALAFNSAYYIGTDIGCVAAGIISLWLARRFGMTAHNARRLVYAGACVLTSFSLLVLWLPKGWALMAAILVVGAGALALFPCYYSFVQELSDRHVGRLTGLLSTWVWAVSSPMHKLFGKLVDETKSFDLGMAMAGLAPWLGVVAMWLLWDRSGVKTTPQAGG